MPESRVRKKNKVAYTPPPSKSAKNLPPSPAWVPVAFMVLFVIAIVWLIGYTLGPLPGQSALGGFNYLIVGVAFVAAVTLLTRWR